MAAVVSVVQNCGSTYSGYANEAAKNISYMLPIDSCTANRSDYPMTIPNAGTKFSYEVYIRCRLDLAPANQVDNFKVWYVGGMPSDHTLTVNSDIVNNYSAPINFQSSKGTRVDFTTKNSEGNSIALNGVLTNVGDYTSYLVFQLEVESTAQTGNHEVDYIIQYDEF